MTDPTITIAGLRAQIDSLYEMLKTANDGRAEKSSAAAWDYAARMRVEAERDALAAQLAEVRAELAAAPKVCAIHSYEHGPGPCMTCGAWPPGTRELIATCRARIAGLEQAANERSAEVARLTARVAELEAAGRAIKITPTLLAAALVGSRDGSVTPAAAAQAERLLSLAGELFIAPPTVAPQPAEVFAGVSIDELCSVYSAAYGERPGHRDDRRPDAIRAVLARLDVSLVAPVDPEAVALQIADKAQIRHGSWSSVIETVRATLTAAGIPVTTEVGK